MAREWVTRARVTAVRLLLLMVMLLAGCVDEPATSVAEAGGTPAGPFAGEPVKPATGVSLVEVGAALFHEPALSSSGTQSCASCHSAGNAFTDPEQTLPVSAGAEAGRFGTRNTPTAMYTGRIPPLALRSTPDGLRWVGGLFVDGRADTLAHQAQVPLFNPLEMNLRDAAELHSKLQSAASRLIFEAYFGANSLADDADADEVLARVVGAIAAFERSSRLQPFSAKFDAVLAGRAQLSEVEMLGMDVFVRRDKGNCIACHSMATGPNGEPPLFSNLRYENIGVPRHPDRRFFAADVIDAGLEATLLGRGIDAASASAQRGKFRVPTLRNIALTAPYMHNGVFSDLRTVIQFYATRDTDRGRWLAIGATEVPATVEREHTGRLALNPREIDALVAFLNTLTDGYVP